MLGERLSAIVSFEAKKLSAGATLLSPYVPLLFMGEEYAEDAPFLYFVSHTDSDLAQAVTNGRREEFKAFHGQGEPPDPQSPETFESSKLRWEERKIGRHLVMLDLYRKLISLRREVPALSRLSKEYLVASALKEDLVVVKRHHEEGSAIYAMNFGPEDVEFSLESAGASWKKALDTSDLAWLGPGSFAPDFIELPEKFHIRPHSLILYLQL
jgi:maltooligosyltrehalose trehalohydrolase